MGHSFLEVDVLQETPSPKAENGNRAMRLKSSESGTCPGELGRSPVVRPHVSHEVGVVNAKLWRDE